jgi:hypothetical protein
MLENMHLEESDVTARLETIATRLLTGILSNEKIMDGEMALSARGLACCQHAARLAKSLLEVLDDEKLEPEHWVGDRQ